jgi:hypothetical protein
MQLQVAALSQYSHYPAASPSVKCSALKSRRQAAAAPRQVRADQLAMALMPQQLSVSTVEPFCVSPCVRHAIRLALGSVDSAALRHALTKVRRATGEVAF